MKFLANENFPLKSIKKLRAANVVVFSILEDSPSIKDEEVLKFAADKNMIILTFDKGYGELIYRNRLTAPLGVLLYRLNEFTEEEPADRLLEILNRKEINLQNQFSVLDEDQIRQRPL